MDIYAEVIPKRKEEQPIKKDLDKEMQALDHSKLNYVIEPQKISVKLIQQTNDLGNYSKQLK